MTINGPQAILLIILLIVAIGAGALWLAFMTG